jgi:hypothetical protein
MTKGKKVKTIQEESKILQEEKSKEIEQVIQDFDDTSIEDFETARSNILSMLKSGTVSVEKLTDLAERSQSARMYEVLYCFITSMVEANKQLLEVQSKIRELKDPDGSSGMNAKTINQTAIFCGSTAELQKVIKTMKLESLAGSNKENDNQQI